ncbi:DUF1183 domain protein [Xylariales sp. AK1849]|nr:DUF1183 domain protein [Xylariales sp. AK1849]
MARPRININIVNIHIPSLPLYSFLTTFFLILLCFTPSAHAAGKPKNAILLSDVQSLTLRSGAKTTHRRTSAVTQLKCISSPSICSLHTIDVLRCTNQGAGYSSEDIQWSCVSSLPPELKLGSTDVICEGYSGPEDDYVLKGSCGVEYRLVLTDKGEEKWPHLGGGGGGRGWGSGKKGSKPKTDGEIDWSGAIFMVIFVAVAAWIIYSACYGAQANRNPRPATRRPRNGGGGGGGWGGGWGPGGGGGGGGGGDSGGYDDPPPPYSNSKKTSSTQQGESWRPGFWSGAGAGAAAGYLAGNRGNNSRQQQQQRDYGSGWGSGSGSGSGGGWFGGGNSDNGSGSSSGSASSARYESTGFGSTSRR